MIEGRNGKELKGKEGKEGEEGRKGSLCALFERNDSSSYFRTWPLGTSSP
jgi:hypothetical protein